MRKFIIGFLSVILVCMLTFFHLYMAIANSIDVTSIKQSIHNNLLSGFIYDEEGNKTDIFMTILELTTLDEDTIIKLMENETADKYITDIVNSIYDYNLTGDVSYKYTGDKIYKIVDENVDTVMREIDYPFSAKDRQEVMNYMNTHMDYIIDTIYSTDIGGYTHD